MKAAASVILYHPDRSVISNIQSYSRLVDVVFAVDNSETANQEWVSALSATGNVIYMSNGENLGIAAALNRAAESAMQSGYSWLLTMDQDSSFEAEEFELYKKQTFQLIQTEKNAGLFCPAEEKTSSGDAITEPAFRITSGTWINLEAWRQIGGFDEKLFIDEVDEDFSCKLHLAGYRLIGFNNVVMKHKLGTKKKAGLLHLFFVRERTLHSPFRIYFMVRNYLIVRKRYAAFFPESYKKRDRDFLVALKNNILFSGNFFQAFPRAMKGFIDYLFNRY
jgi:rhamnosyltransferase